jgi:dual specificity phosphatase 3
MTTSQTDRGITAFTTANAHFVTPRLAVAGDLDNYDPGLAGRQAHDLQAHGISHVLDVRQEWNDEELMRSLAPTITYRHLGVDDAGQRIPAAWFEEVASWALAALADPDAKVLTHCHMGINRGPSAGFAILLALGWEPVAALDAIRSARPIAYIDYAEDALRWHHARTNVPADLQAADRAAVRRWRQENQMDVGAVIRGIRAADCARRSGLAA